MCVWEREYERARLCVSEWSGDNVVCVCVVSHQKALAGQKMCVLQCPPLLELFMGKLDTHTHTHLLLLALGANMITRDPHSIRFNSVTPTHRRRALILVFS